MLLGLATALQLDFPLDTAFPTFTTGSPSEEKATYGLRLRKASSVSAVVFFNVRQHGGNNIYDGHIREGFPMVGLPSFWHSNLSQHFGHFVFLVILVLLR
jgi:hypothetical protein